MTDSTKAAPHTEVLVDTIPDCDLCRLQEGYTWPAVADARLPKEGSWAYVCDIHFVYEGCALGLGQGQKLVQR